MLGGRADPPSAVMDAELGDLRGSRYPQAAWGDCGQREVRQSDIVGDILSFLDDTHRGQTRSRHAG
jgi:hypothetical protein